MSINEENESSILTIQLLGGFSVQKGGEVLTDQSKRSKHLWLLMAYLLVCYKQRVPISYLIELLWGEKECFYPERALQNLIYRLRNILSADDEEINYIFHSHGTYYWNTEAPFELDICQFDKTLEMAERADRQGEETAEALYRAALVYYKGELLPEYGYGEWLAPYRNHYKTAYLKAVSRLSEILQTNQQLETLIQICTRATQLEPLEESIYKTKIDALLDLGKIAQAREEYEHISQLLSKELGAKPGAELEKTYNKMRVHNNAVQMDLGIIENMMGDTSDTGGAYYCYNPEAFKAIYHIEKRRMPRASDITVSLIVLTVLAVDYSQLDEEVLNHVMDLLLDDTISQLRRGDVITRWSASQLLLLVHSSHSFECNDIIERIKSQFQKDYKGQRVILKSKYTVIEPTYSIDDVFGDTKEP